VAKLDESGTNLDLAILSLVGTEDLRGENVLLVICDSPYIGGASTRWAITGLEQRDGEIMGRG